MARVHTAASKEYSFPFEKNTIGGVVGNILEWYDFAVFGYFAPLIGTLFFPSGDKLISLLSAFGVFATAYFVRPVGGLIFGYVGDRFGRKAALQLSVMMMAIPTTLIGFLPTHAQIGGVATGFLVLLRLVQGISVGGELIGSISFITETAPRGSKGLFGSLALCTSTAGVMIGSLVAFTVQSSLSPEALEAWGWRIPFLAGFWIGAVALWMRDGLSETPDFERAKSAGDIGANPIAEVIWSMPGRIFHVSALVMLSGGGFYLLFVWWPTFLRHLVRPAIHHALIVNTISMMVLMCLIPLSGWLSDRLGRVPVLMVSALGVVVFAYPLFVLVDHGTFVTALMAQLIFAVLMSGFTGPIPATMVEMFPARTRFSGIAIGYNLSLSTFGGTAPLVGTWLVLHTGSTASPAIYLSGLAFVSLLAVVGLRWGRFAETS